MQPRIWGSCGRSSRRCSAPWWSALQKSLVAYRALVGTGGQQGVGLERGGDLAGARLGGFPALGVLPGAALSQLLVGHQQVDAALRDVDEDPVAVADQADGAGGRRLRRDVADRQARSAAGEAAVGDQAAVLTQGVDLRGVGRVDQFLNRSATVGRSVAVLYHGGRLLLIARLTFHGGGLTSVDRGPATEQKEEFGPAEDSHTTTY